MKREMIKPRTVATFLFLSVCCTTQLLAVLSAFVDRTKSGDVVIAALLPVSKGNKCQNENPVGVLLSEALVHSVSKNHSSLKRNFTIGYYIKDTCGDPRVAVQAAFDLVSSRTPSREHKSSRGDHEEMRRRIVAVVVDSGSDSSTRNSIKGILDAYGLPQILIGQKSFGERTLRKETTQVTSELLKALDYSLVTVLGSDVVGSPASLLESELTSQGYCLAAATTSTRGQKGSEMNPRQSTKVRAKRWQSVARADLVVVLSDVEKAQEILEDAGEHGVQNKTWVIVDETTTRYYALRRTHPGDVILVMAKDIQRMFSELKKLQRYLTKHQEKIERKMVRGKIGMETSAFLSKWSRFIQDYPHNTESSSVSLISSANRAADVVSAVSKLRSTLNAILCPKTTVCEPKTIAYLRTKMKWYFTKDRSFDHSCSNTASSGSSRCNGPRYVLRKARRNNNTTDTRTFPRVGDWDHKSGWKLSPSEVNTSKKRQNVWKCPTGRPVKLPSYWDNSCRQFACLTCPTVLSWRNNSCRLCTARKCSEIPLVYLKFSHPFALTVTCLCVFSEACVIFVVVIFVKYRETPVVKSSNRVFNFLMLSTLSLLFAVTPSFLGRPGYLRCNGISAAFLMFYATVSSILFSKTFRLLLIFKSMQQRQKFLGNTSFFLTTIVFVLIQAFLCAMSAFLHPVDVESRFLADTVLLHCGRSSSPATAIGFVYNCLLSGLCSIFAYKARKLPKNFNEAKYILFTIFSYAFSWMIVLTGYYDVYYSAKQTTVTCLGLAVGGLSVLACLFFPKLYTIFFCPQLNTKSVTVEAARRYSVEASVCLGGIRSDRIQRSSTVEFPCMPRSGDNFLGVVGAARPRMHSDSSITELTSLEGTGNSPASSLGSGDTIPV